MSDSFLYDCEARPTLECVQDHLQLKRRKLFQPFSFRIGLVGVFC